MTSRNENLFKITESMGLSQVDIATLVGVTPRAVQFWYQSEHQVPGPVMAYFKLLESLPFEGRCKELSQLEKFKGFRK